MAPRAHTAFSVFSTSRCGKTEPALLWNYDISKQRVKLMSRLSSRGASTPDFHLAIAHRPLTPLILFHTEDIKERLTSWPKCCQAEYITDSVGCRRWLTCCVVFTKVHRSLQGYRRPDEWDSDGVARGFTVCRLIK